MDKLHEWVLASQDGQFNDHAQSAYKSLDMLASAIRAKLAENKDQA